MTITVLALPAVSHAGDSLITRKPVKVNKGFKLSLFATQALKSPGAGLPAQPASVSAFLTRGPETASYDFRKGIRFSARKNLKSGRIKGSFVQHRGRINMAFRATSKARKAPVPKGCTGKPGAQRNGILRGKFRLKADRLKTVRIKRIKVTLVRPATITNCNGNPGGGGAFHGTVLNASRTGSHRRVDVFAQKPRHGRVNYSVSFTKFTNAYVFSWGINLLSAPRTAYTSSSDLSKGTLRSVGPQLAGTAHFSGSPVVGGSLADGFSSGRLGGTLRAKLRSIGTLRPFKGGKLQAVQSRS
jgi:hypothetical protein